MRPIQIPSYISTIYDINPYAENLTGNIQARYAQLAQPAPLVSVIIPAYNEETTILQTLYSLCHNRTQKSIEIIVVNNNSTDRTFEMVTSSGIPCINEPKQGITNARNAGLAVAKGTYILNADADTIYPENWIDRMIDPLIENESIAGVYGCFSFIPTASTGRLTYFFYEYLADFSRWLNKRFREEAMNAYGFNSGFRREQGLAVEGFNHPPGTNEDGWLMLKLSNHGFGKLHLVFDADVLVWTTDRRIQLDGGLWMGLWKRAKRMVGL